MCQAHIHNLLFTQHTEKKPLKFIFFPILTHVPSFGENVMDKTSCPIVAGVPDVMKAAFTKEVDFFAQRGIEYLSTAMSFGEMHFTAKRMFQTWGPRLGITEDESDHAHREGMRALAAYDNDLQEKGRAILETVENENRVTILMVARPYHSDPGLNHGIPEEFQVLGYPILSTRSIPRDFEYLSRYFKEEIARGQHPLDINDVWPENYSANSAQKVWAVKFAARHPNVVLLDLSSFKCGHDSPTYGIVESIVSASATPYQALHDIDANKPGGSIKIRVKTFAHSLKLYQETLEDVASKKGQLDLSLDKKRLELLQLRHQQLADRRQTDPVLENQINMLAEKVRNYEAPKKKPEPPRDLVQLKKKQADGSTVPVSTGA